MAGSTYGKILTMTTWGESHGAGVGVVVDGCPAGLALCEEDVQRYLDRRKPGQSRFTTKRSESDTVEILSGVFDDRTRGSRRYRGKAAGILEHSGKSIHESDRTGGSGAGSV